MNKISDEIIKKELEEQMDFLKTKYNDKQYLGLFTYGKVNYGFAESVDEIQTVFCYIPTFKELCTENVIDIYYIPYKNRKIRICDIRLLKSLALHQEQIIMEAVFSDYYILNPRYKKIFNKYIYINREAIFHCNQKLRIQNALIRGKQAIDNYIINHDNNILFNACRIRIATRLYIDGTACENCINLKKDYYINYLWQIKNGEIQPNINEIKNDFISMEQEAAELIENDKCKDLIENAITELMKVALTDMIQDQDFTTLLTKTENKALEIILNELESGYEGNISISNLTENSNISRPVFTKLLQKMKDYKIAEIENQGVKGTYIKIIDGNLLSE
ncbi:MAG: hypothetical protein ACI4PE_02735 [Bacilli bacterium]